MSKKRNVFIGGAWPYANSTLHIGHLSGLLAGDILARYFRSKGDNVIYVSGSDCHGTPITLRAIKENKTPKEVAELYHKNFVETFEMMNFSYDYYGKTTSKNHLDEVKKMIEKLYENEYIYEKEELQPFCSKCKKFLNDREITYNCPECGKKATIEGCDCGNNFDKEDIDKANCAICNSNPILKKDKNLYLKLSKVQEELENYFHQNNQRWRLNAINETRKYLKQKVHDRAITRNLEWGVDVPIKGYENKKIYVWIEAVMGYITTCKQYCKENNLNWQDFLIDADLNYMVHGKDNIIFHSIIFPAILMGLDQKFKLPTDIVSSEFLNMNGEKISKTLGNYEETKNIIEKGSSDTLRFYLMFHGPEKKDGDFTHHDYKAIHNGEVLNKFGNFMSRTINFKNLEKFEVTSIDKEVETKIKNAYIEIGEKIETYKFREATSLLLEFCDFANTYYDNQKPWILFKEDKDKFAHVFYNCSILALNMANLFFPFMPNASEKILKYYDVKKPTWMPLSINEEISIDKIDPLFSRIK